MQDVNNTFESFVNSGRCKTIQQVQVVQNRFESFVNSERCKTSPFLIGLVV